MRPYNGQTAGKATNERQNVVNIARNVRRVYALCVTLIVMAFIASNFSTIVGQQDLEIGPGDYITPEIIASTAAATTYTY